MAVPEVLAAGVPEIVPVALAMVRPDGRPEAENVYGVVPPEAATGVL